MGLGVLWHGSRAPCVPAADVGGVQELSRRTDTLIRLVEKEQEEYDAVDADEPKVLPRS